jgi:hypothetical protein
MIVLIKTVVFYVSRMTFVVVLCSGIISIRRHLLTFESMKLEYSLLCFHQPCLDPTLVTDTECMKFNITLATLRVEVWT